MSLNLTSLGFFKIEVTNGNSQNLKGLTISNHNYINIGKFSQHGILQDSNRAQFFKNLKRIFIFTCSQITECPM